MQVYKASLDDSNRGTVLRKELARHTEYAKLFGEIQTFIVDAHHGAEGSTAGTDGTSHAQNTAESGAAEQGPGRALSTWRHPKFQKMMDLLQEHFNTHARANDSTRVIIFATYWCLCLLCSSFYVYYLMVTMCNTS